MEATLSEVKDMTAQAAFGMTHDGAIHVGICIRCKQPPRFYSEAGRREYSISGLCEYCFDVITGIEVGE